MNHFSFRKNQGLQFLVCEPLEQAGFVNAFSTRITADETQLNEFTLGHSKPEWRDRIAANRQKFKAAVGAGEAKLVTARQIHSADIRSLKDLADAQTQPQPGDALTANLPNVLLGIQTADCLPILIADVKTRAVAGVHAGWRGTVQKILALTIEQMKQAYNSQPEDLHAALGPAICAENFEVGAEVLEQFRQEFSYADSLFSNLQPNGKGHIDLNRCNIQQLLDAGLRAENIYNSARCTIAENELFFSYRKENGAERSVGRLMSVIGRKQ